MAGHPYMPPQRGTPQQQEYHQGDKPFQIPWWAIVGAFIMQPVLGIVLLVVNAMMRQPGSAAAPRRRATGTAAGPIYAQNGAPQAAPRRTAASRKMPVDDGAKLARLLLIAGVVLTVVGAGATFDALDMLFWSFFNTGDWFYWLEDVFTGLLPLGLGVGSLIGSVVTRNAGRLRKKIANIVGKADHMYIRDIAAAVPCTEEKARKALENCIDKGVFGAGAYLDMRTGCLVVRGPAPEPAPPPEPEPAPAEPARPGNDQYAQILQELHSVNEAIPGDEMTAKISRLEAVSARIFEEVSAHPDKLPQMRKFMDYYLPTSLKLLKTYAELDAQPVAGENIRLSKQRIEQAMDTVVVAFENQLDQLFSADALDVSADIEVMQNMLRADGLTGSDGAGVQGPRLQL